MRIPPWLARRPALPVPVLATLLSAIAGGCYLNSLQAPFLLDDLTTIVANPTITQLSPLSDVLFPPGEIYSAGRPVLNLSFALNYAIGGHAVGGYHVINTLIHVAAALVLFGIVRRTLDRPQIDVTLRERASGLAFFVAALWAAHPLLTSAVTYISQRAESLMGLFYLLTFYCFVRGAERRSLAWMLTGTLVCALGMATKEVMVTAPFVVFLFDRVFVAGSWREAWTQRRTWHLLHASTWLVLFGLMLSSRLGQRAVGFEHGLTWFSYLCLETQAVSIYLLRAVWPVNLVFDYGANLPAPATLAVVGASLLLGTLLAVSMRALWRGAALGFLGTVFFVLLAPTSSVVPLAGQPIAESRMYLPLATLVTAAVVVAAKFLPRIAPVFGCATLAVLATLTHQRNEVYRSTESIWADNGAKRPANGRAMLFWAEELKRQGRMAEALTVLETNIRAKPDSAEMLNNLAVSLFQAGRQPEAFQRVRRALELNPQLADGHVNLGTMLLQTGQFAAALESLAQALQLGRETADVRNFTGLCLIGLGRPAEAKPQFERALQLNPNHKDARANLAVLLAVPR